MKEDQNTSKTEIAPDYQKENEELRKLVETLQQQLMSADAQLKAAQLEAADYSKALIRICKLINM